MPTGQPNQFRAEVISTMREYKTIRTAYYEAKRKARFLKPLTVQLRRKAYSVAADAGYAPGSIRRMIVQVKELPCLK